MPSSSAPVTTAWSLPPTWPRPDTRSWCLERRHVVGGAAVSEEVFPGFTFSVLSYVVSLFRPSIIRESGSARHGMELIPLETSFTPHQGGPGLCRWPEAGRSRQEISRFSAKDAEIYPEFSLTMTKMAASPATSSTRRHPTRLHSCQGNCW